jgi:nitroreductase
MLLYSQEYLLAFMILTRRNFILMAGTTAVIVAAGKTALDLDKMPSTAIAAWSEPRSDDLDIRKRVLSYAILAPNPHNMQPWLVDLRQPDQIDLYCDLTRLLPETDPFSRQILIGHGAFLELLDLAASAAGHRTEITYFPKGEFGDRIDERPVASIRLIPDPNRKPDPLFQQILKRRSTKNPFDPIELLPAHGEKLATAYNNPDCQLTIATDRSRVLGLRGALQSGIEIEMRTPHTHKESIDVIRIGASEVEQYRNGVSLTGAAVGWGRIFGYVSREKLVDPTSQVFNMVLNRYRELSLATPAFAWMTTSDNRRTTQLEVGRAYARLDLKATELGVAIHPMSQVLQEYKEIQPLQQGVLSMLDIPKGQKAQMLVRLGYAKRPDPTPRRDLQDLILPS